ncbi:MAG: EFR1 family ferrodoxin [Butyrivibrio sp.]|nr:EFR1 family ferrodoxin [Butyrivibrio sp.]
MKIRQIKAVYFSPVGATRTVVQTVAAAVSEKAWLPMETVDFTLPGERTEHLRFAEDELVVFGMPTYAGRVPNKALPFVKELFSGSDTPAIALVTFGNRDYDSSLTELAGTLEESGFRIFAAAALVSRHVFSPQVMAKGRPDESDLEMIRTFAEKAYEKLQEAPDAKALSRPVIRNGEEVQPYYTPLGIDGLPAQFLKAKPKTDTNKCYSCRICVNMCPFGSIDQDCVSVPGLCVKCHACVRRCPTGAKYFDDPAYLSHVKMLETNYATRTESEMFF